MTTTEQPAAGWWLASDGNWYPPEHADQPEPSRKKRRRWPWVVGGMIMALVVINSVSGKTPEKAEDAKPGRQSVATVAPTAAPTTAAPTTAAPPTTAAVSVSQSNANRSATNYLKMTAFSRSGLIKQLQFEGFSEPESAQAADSLNADWNEQAARSAKSYLEMSSFSRKSLIDQLKFEGYTDEQAQHGAGAVGL